MRGLSVLSISVALGLASSVASAGIIQIDQSAFNAGAGLITFSEVPLGSVNPVYTPGLYGGGAGSPTVTFGGYFTGQSAGSTNPSACPTGAAVTGCVLGSPTGPLSIDPNSPTTFTADDASVPSAPILSGSPLYNGSIAILFSTPQVGVGLDGGYFNAVGSTAITAFAADGSIIGSVTNSQTGNEFLGLVTDDGQATIAGLEFSLVGDEPAGFDIDNLEFGVQGQVTVPGGQVPEPSTIALLGTGLMGLMAVGARKLA